MSSETAFKSTANRQSAGLRRAGHLALVFMLTATTLLSLATSVEAAAGDFSVSSPESRAGKDAVYKATYFASEEVTDPQFELVLPGESNQYKLDKTDGSVVTHTYASTTHKWDVFQRENVDENMEWVVRFNLTGTYPANYKLTFDVKVTTPLAPASYTVGANYGEAPTTGTLPPLDTDWTHTTSTSKTILMADPGTSTIVWDAPKNAGNPASKGPLKFLPADDSKSLVVTVPRAFTPGTLTAGWAKNAPATDTAPWLLTYTGSGVIGGSDSSIDFGAFELPGSVASFTFTVLEKDANGAHQRSNTFKVDIIANSLVELSFATVGHGQQLAGEEHATRINIDGFHDLKEEETLFVQFPTGFLLNNVDTSEVTLSTGSSVAPVDEAINVATRTLSFTVQEGESIDGSAGVTLDVFDLVVPKRIGATEMFHVYTHDANGNVVDEVNALTFNVLARGALTAVTLQPQTLPAPLTEGRAGQDGAIDVSFKLKTANPTEVRAYFPAGIPLKADGNYSVILGNATNEVESNFLVDPARNAITFSLEGRTIGEGGLVEANIQGFKFPVSTASRTFRFVTVDAQGVEWDNAAPSAKVVANPLGTLIPARGQSDLGATGTFKVTVPAHDLLVNGSKIQISFSEGYTLGAASPGITVGAKTVEPNNRTISGSVVTITLTDRTAVTTEDVELGIKLLKNPKLRYDGLEGGTVSVTFMGADGTSTATGTTKMPALTIPDGAPVAYHMTQSDLEAFNDLIELDVKETRDGMRLRWTLPEGELVVRGQQVPVEGIQIWESNSPYSLIATYDADEDEFGLGEHMEPLTSDNPKFLVTMFYTDDIGKYESGEAPDTDDYPGTESSGVVWTWQWFVIGGVALILVAVVVLLVVLNRRR